MKTTLLKVGSALLISVFISLNTNHLYAQVADSLSLPEISISANRFDISDNKLSTMIQRINVDEVADAGFLSAGDLLRRNSRYIVRTYGPGQAQTVGSIGFNASQVKVIWNGIELNHPMLGLVDLSLFPASLIDEISVDNHLGSSEYGSSAIGGTVIMESGFQSDPMTQAEISRGSFNALQYSLLTGGNSGKWSYTLAFNSISQDNDFSYEIEDNSTQKRLNSDKQQNTILASARYSHNNYWGDASIWLSSGETGAPGSLSFPSLEARQKDRSVRFVHRSNWMHNERYQSQLSTSFNRIGLDYADPAWGTNSVSDVDVTSVNYALRIKPAENYQIRFRSGLDVAQIRSTDFRIEDATRVYTQLNGLISVGNTLNLYPSIRFDSYSEFDNALSYGIGANYELIVNQLFLVGNLNRNYAPPTFNDLYWPGFGNPNLVPETSFKSDIGIKYVYNQSTIGISYINSSIDNGILWWADETGSFSPNNVNELKSSGLTTDVRTNLGIGTGNFEVGGSWTWLNATYDMRGEDGTLQGNRVVYTPEHRIGADIGYSLRYTGIVLNYEYTSERPVNDLNSLKLDPIHLLNLTAHQTIPVWKTEVTVTLSIQNITDQTYQLIYDYPMPGRSWNLGIRVSI